LDNNDKNNSNGNNEGINLEDFEQTEDYEPTDGFHHKIIDMLTWTHEDLVENPGTSSALHHEALRQAHVLLVLLQL
jgi:hypothetical protein